MTAIQDDDRELLLSLYIDGELEAERIPLVEEKLRTDPLWKSEFEALRASEDKVSKTVESNWYDQEFTEKVAERLKTRKIQSWTSDAPPPREPSVLLRYLPWAAACAALLLFGLLVTTWYLQHNRKPGGTLGATVATVRMLDGSETELHAGELFTAEGAGACANVDGTLLWLRPGAQLTVQGARKVTLQNGEVLAVVRPDVVPFQIALPSQATVEALGTRFDVALNAQGVRVRVVEGHVQYKDGAKLVDLLGAQALGTDGALKRFDPREAALEWKELLVAPASNAPVQAEHAASLWPQVGGGPEHNGQTPASGPDVLKEGRLVPYPKVDNAADGGQYAPAVAGLDGTLFVLRPANDKSMQLWNYDDQAKSWTKCGAAVSGISQHAPVVTPKGLVVFGTSSGEVYAYSPREHKQAWQKNVGSSVFGVCAAYNGALLCSTYARLVALDAEGREAWSFDGFTDIQAPAAVGPDGTIYVASRSGKLAALDASGTPLRQTRVTLGTSELLFLPPVVAPSGKAWFTSTAGQIAAWSATGQLEPVGNAGRVALPLGLGVEAVGTKLRFADGSELDLKNAQEPLSALALDASGQLYASTPGTLWRVKLDAGGKRSGVPEAKPSASAEAAVPGGIMILPGKVIVTTPAGLVIHD